MKMACLNVFVGIDVSKDWLDIHLRPVGEEFRVPNTEVGWRDLAGHLSNHPLAKVAAEASGGYEKSALRYLAKAGFEVH
jgi:transposase